MSKFVAMVWENPIASTALLIARFASRNLWILRVGRLRAIDGDNRNTVVDRVANKLGFHSTLPERAGCFCSTAGA